MSNSTYNLIWRDTMVELNEQVHIEDNTLDVVEGGEPPPPPPQASIIEAFQHFACLYIKYLQIFKKLEMCYDAMVQPQKRIDVKMVLELVIRRVLELKHELVKWNPPNADLRFPPPAPEEAFPWDYVNLDDILVDLKLSPDTLDVTIPRYFKQDNAKEIAARDELIKGYVKLHLNETVPIPLDDKDGLEAAVGEMTLEKAMEIVQRNERGRQGKQKALMLKEIREEERRRRIYDTAEQLEMDPEIAAANIQETQSKAERARENTNMTRLLRGVAARERAKKEREEEMVYIGMKPAVSEIEELQRELDIAYRKRKQEQADNKEAYEDALEDLKDVVLEEEGPEIQEALREERTLWVTGQIAQDRFPEDLEAFYLLKNPPAEEKPPAENEVKKKGKKGKDTKGDKGKGGKKGKKGGKGGKGGDNPDVLPERPPPLQGKSDLAQNIFSKVKHFSNVWENRDESDNFAQKHDVSLAKDKIRPSVVEVIRKQVDEMLILNLKKIKMQVAKQADKKGKKRGKGKKGRKKGKKKGGKKGKKKGLPGDKISELKHMDMDQMLGVLVANRIICTPTPRCVSDLVGDFNYLGMIHQHTERREGEWVPQDPSMAQLRQLITEFCILPIGSQQVKSSLKPEHNLKALMLYGPAGAGKTMMVEAVASGLGALVINLSPRRLKGLFPGKTGPTKLLHMAFKVAKDPSMAPVVIYIDECDQMFVGGGKKGRSGDKDGASRFKKDAITYKNKALEAEDRVIIIGCTSKPETKDVKEYKNFFQKFLYLPAPDYASRFMLWHHFIRERLEQASKGHSAQVSSSVDLSTLAHVSEGYTAGSIHSAVKTTLTPRRIYRMANRPLLSSEFLGVLAQQQQLLKKDVQVYQDFTAKITGLEDRRKRIKDAKELNKAAGNAKGGKGKGKGEKGGKKTKR